MQRPLSNDASAMTRMADTPPQLKTYLLKGAPRGKTYRALLDFCGQSSAMASLVYFESAPAEPDHPIRDALSTHRLGAYFTTVWPANGSLDPAAPIFPDRYLEFYGADDALGTLLKSATNALYRWCMPALPEDLSFSRSDGTVLLATITHERIAFLQVDEREKAAFSRCCPALNLKLMPDRVIGLDIVWTPHAPPPYMRAT